MVATRRGGQASTRMGRQRITGMHSASGRMLQAGSPRRLLPRNGLSCPIPYVFSGKGAAVLAIIFGTIAARGSAAPRWIIVVLALIPVATAGFVYHFIGNFIGGHVFLTAGVAAILGGPLYPGRGQD